MSKDNGGPAFPATFEEMARYAETGYWSAAHGMTLRDYFASKAPLETLKFEDAEVMAKFAGCEVPKDEEELITAGMKAAAKAAFIYADAMLKERAK